MSVDAKPRMNETSALSSCRIITLFAPSVVFRVPTSRLMMPLSTAGRNTRGLPMAILYPVVRCSAAPLFCSGGMLAGATGGVEVVELGGGGAACSFVFCPHCEQNGFPSSITAPQFGQYFFTFDI